MSTPAEEPDPAPADPDDGRPAQPIWWVAVPVLVLVAGVYQLLAGDTGGFWPWGQVVLIVAGLAALAFVLVDRRR